MNKINYKLFQYLMAFILFITGSGCTTTITRVVKKASNPDQVELYNDEKSTSTKINHTSIIKFNIKTIDSEGESVGDVKLSYYYGDDKTKTYYYFYTNQTNENGEVESYLKIPNASKKICITTDHTGNKRYIFYINADAQEVTIRL